MNYFVVSILTDFAFGFLAPEGNSFRVSPEPHRLTKQQVCDAFHFGNVICGGTAMFYKMNDNMDEDTVVIGSYEISQEVSL